MVVRGWLLTNVDRKHKLFKYSLNNIAINSSISWLFEIFWEILCSVVSHCFWSLVELNLLVWSLWSFFRCEIFWWGRWEGRVEGRGKNHLLNTVRVYRSELHMLYKVIVWVAFLIMKFELFVRISSMSKQFESGSKVLEMSIYGRVGHI